MDYAYKKEEEKKQKGRQTVQGVKRNSKANAGAGMAAVRMKGSIFQQEAEARLPKRYSHSEGSVIQRALEDYYDAEKAKIDYVFTTLKENYTAPPYAETLGRLEAPTMQYLHGDQPQYSDYKATVLSVLTGKGFPQQEIDDIEITYQNRTKVSAAKEYLTANKNNYMTSRGKQGVKLILGRLEGEGGEAEERADTKKSAVALIPYLDSDNWTGPVNDAFIGGGIDAEARFKIYDVNDFSQDYILRLQQRPDADKEKSFFNFCVLSGDTDLYNGDDAANGGFRYTVLAREIGQLLGKGYFFAKIPKKAGGTNFQAFPSEAAYHAYIAQRAPQAPAQVPPIPPIP